MSVDLEINKVFCVNNIFKGLLDLMKMEIFEIGDYEFF